MRNEAKVVATLFALAAFAVAIVAGIYAGNSAASILSRAIAAMFACQLVGMIAGAIIERIITDHETAYSANNPIPGAAPEKAIVVDEAVDQPAP